MSLITKLGIFFTLILGLFNTLGFGGYSSNTTAVVGVKSVFYNDSMYVEPGSPEDLRRQEMRDAEPTRYTVKAGDEIDNGCIKIKAVSEDSVTFKMNWDYTDCSGDPTDTFTVKRGECITIYEYGLCDATSYYVLSYPNE